jgi:hypothetical protein
MAVNISKDLTTQEGFVVSECFGFLSIYLLNDSWTNVSYFKSEADYLVKQFEDDIQKLTLLLDRQKHFLRRYEFRELTELREKQKDALLQLDQTFLLIQKNQSTFLKFDQDSIKQILIREIKN